MLSTDFNSNEQNKHRALFNKQNGVNRLGVMESCGLFDLVCNLDT